MLLNRRNNKFLSKTRRGWLSHVEAAGRQDEGINHIRPGQKRAGSFPDSTAIMTCMQNAKSLEDSARGP